ncbi:RluA family pseudouridine synthase [Waterburya agarophytonicola K14]|uniref:Pseudouridine synthase n=1 Tax=Waterburya agarophytonicola KI4 TaxID=2874699 RepID=A0A964BU86_9CYAN|nr:RluA family pseudouridine synthase [Waterburya agarophytonicola KI4]
MQEIILQVTEQNERLDRWLSSQLTDISRSRIQKLIESGNVRLNDRLCHSKKVKIVPGDRLLITIPPPEKLDLTPENIPLDILYEDEHLIIVNKPAGMVVHPAPGHYRSTLVHALLYHCQTLAGIGGVERPGIVHRIDKDTTGAIVVAKSDLAHQNLQAQIKAKTARREYWGIMYGSFSTESGKINAPIGRHQSDRKKMAVVTLEKGGREAVTYWKTLERIGNYSLMQFLLETGRTHQIRVHCAHQGNPLLGDPIYGSNRSLKVNLSGQALHARQLSLSHPISGKLITAIAPLPLEFTKLLQVLRNRN